MSNPIIITTRPYDDAQQDIADLDRLNINALAAPMLDIEPLSHHAKAQHNVDAVVFTSRHAPALVDQSLHHLACYCVGQSTAQAAEKAGFQKVISGPGDGQGLVAAIDQHNQTAPDHDRIAQVFWPSAVDTGFNIADALRLHDIKTERVPVYKAATTNHWPQHVHAAIQNRQVGAVLMHSGRAGEHFTQMMQQHGLDEYRQFITAIVISRRAAGLCGQGWHNIKIAATPRRSAMFAAAAEALGLPPTCLDGIDLDQDL